MNKKIFLFPVILACFGLGFAAPTLLLVKTVATTHPAQGKAVEAVYATGNVEPTIMVPIAPRTSAHLTELAAEEGQTVKKGDILARLEDSDAQAVIANLSAKLSFAETNYKRKQRLYDLQSTSRDALDSAKADFDSLTAQLAQAKAQAGYLTLMSPADGLIIKRDGEIGELISASQPIFYLSCCAPLRITAEVDEEDIPQVKPDQKVLIQADAFPDKVFEGQVASITPKGDSVGRSYRVRITYKNTDAPLMIGMTTELNIIIKEESNTLQIPTLALGKNNKVQIAENGILKTVSVTTGIKGPEKVEIKDGLTTTSEVLSPYRSDLTDGQKLRTKPAEADNKESRK